jgi:hypothetical protein
MLGASIEYCFLSVAGASQGVAPLSSSSLDSSTLNYPHWIPFLPSFLVRLPPPSTHGRNTKVQISILSDPSAFADWPYGTHSGCGSPYLIGLQRLFGP